MYVCKEFVFKIKCRYCKFNEI